jgi:uncharacterized protein (DUF2267 family)
MPAVTALEVFLREVRIRGLPRGVTPEQAAGAVFCVLDQRLPGGLAVRLQDQLAVDLGAVRPACTVPRAAPAQAFGREEFLRRLGALLGCAGHEAEQAARSVFAAARHVLSARRLLHRVDRELPHDLRDLWESDAVAPPEEGTEPSGG